MSLKLTVNELSKVTGVSSRTLRYYDEIGLFSSSGSLPNGYRYYSIDKIEEIHFINYMRHIGLSIKEIKQHLSNRNIEEYEHILTDHLVKVRHEIDELQKAEKRIQKRIHSLDYIRKLPPIGEIVIQRLQKRRILKEIIPIKKQEDWEFSLAKLESDHGLPPSMIIGDLGFFVDIEKVEFRDPEEFFGLFLLADDPYYDKIESLSYLEQGQWLTLYIRGDHKTAKENYITLIKYAKDHGLTLGDYAIERTIIDHYISSDPNLYITEIQIPIL